MCSSKIRRKDLIKNRNDKRYIDNQGQLERAIGKYLKLGWISRLDTPTISNEACVCGSTFYNHYIHMDEAISLYFHKMEPELRCLAKEIDDLEKQTSRQSGGQSGRQSGGQCSGQSLDIVFFKILYFVYQNREYYEVVMGRGYSQALTKIAETFRPLIKRGWSNYGAEVEEKCFCMFSWEMSGVLYYWGCFESFDYDRIERHAKVLSRLAQNTTKRLVEG